jgi:hypothetical protein
LQLNQAVECGFVHLAVFERGDYRGVSADEHNQFALKSAKAARLASRKLQNDLKRACPAAAACIISVCLERIQPSHHPAQDDLPSLDLPAPPGATAREWHRHAVSSEALAKTSPASLACMSRPQ